MRAARDMLNCDAKVVKAQLNQTANGLAFMR